jgi:hypothetical protein
MSETRYTNLYRTRDNKSIEMGRLWKEKKSSDDAVDLSREFMGTAIITLIKPLEIACPHGWADSGQCSCNGDDPIGIIV